MLTVSQCVTVAYYRRDCGEIICRDCAVREYSSIGIERLDEGLSSSASNSLEPLIRYSLDEIIGECAANDAEDQYSYAADPEKWQAAYDAAPDSYPCDSCGEAIS
jgi:hypothetical protein